MLVPADSRFRTFDDFGAHLLARPGQTPLAGGPLGDPDHLLFGLIAKGVGADTRQVDYTGYPSSAEAATALFAGRAAAVVGTLADWRAHIDQGRVRVLAVSCASGSPGWTRRACWSAGSGSTSPTGAPASGRPACPRRCTRRGRRHVRGGDGVDRLAAAVPPGGWLPIPLAGEEFVQWLASEIGRTRAVLRDLGLLGAR